MDLQKNKKIYNTFNNKKILITGGTGSIGLSIAKSLLKLNPNAIRIFSNDENSIFEAKKIIINHPKVNFILGDIRDKDRLSLALRGIDIVFHAAAMKHVEICEENPFDAVKTNVVGTSNLLEVALIENVSKFILISTDKATHPTTTLGASKLLSERLTMNAGRYRGTGKTIFSIVRFGNVIGSRGSVLQIFKENLQKDHNLIVTDSRMSRFMMSLTDASEMILNVTSIANDAEIYILKMPTVKITELAEKTLEIYKKYFNKKCKSKIDIKKLEKRERLNEYLISNDELEFCQDLGNMYKISQKHATRKLSINAFDSSTARNISEKELVKIIKQSLTE